MTRRIADGLDAEDLKLLEEMRRADREMENSDLPPPGPELQERMQLEALASGALMVPGPKRDAYLEIKNMSRDEFEAEFADVLYANAHDEDED